MRVKLICKASKSEGLGHLFRSLSLAQYIFEHRKDWDSNLIIISRLNLHHILDNHDLKYIQIQNEEELKVEVGVDVLILDMLSMKTSNFKKLKSRSNKTISISPIFNQMENCDLLITRTKYFDRSWSEKMEVKAGLEYSIIRPDCHQINTGHYKNILDLPSFQIAISMGGTDPHNLSFDILKNLVSFQGRALFWVILGEGYSHNYHDLVEIIKKNSKHEIILARTNKSMWNIMANCSIAILAGGITSYEAAYAGLPAINYYHLPEKSYLTDELVEKRLCVKNSFSFEDTISDLNQIFINKHELLKIHESCIKSFTKNPIENILYIIDEL